jgi:hypothetical protein
MPTKPRGNEMNIETFANSLTAEQYIRLLDIADPNPMTPEEKAKYAKMSDDELLSELMA